MKISKKNLILRVSLILLVILSITSISFAGKDLLSPRVAGRAAKDETVSHDFYLGLEVSRSADTSRTYWGRVKGVRERENGRYYSQYLIDANHQVGAFILTFTTTYKEVRNLNKQSISFGDRWEYFGAGLGLTTKEYDSQQLTYSLHLWAPLPNGQVTLVISEDYTPYWNGKYKQYLDEKKVWFLEGSAYYGEKDYWEAVLGADIPI